MSAEVPAKQEEGAAEQEKEEEDPNDFSVFRDESLSSWSSPPEHSFLDDDANQHLHHPPRARTLAAVGASTSSVGSRRRRSAGTGARSSLRRRRGLGSAFTPVKRVSFDVPLRLDYAERRRGEDGPEAGKGGRHRFRLPPVVLRTASQPVLNVTTTLPAVSSRWGGEVTAAVTSQVGIRGRVGHSASTAEIRYKTSSRSSAVPRRDSATATTNSTATATAPTTSTAATTTTIWTAGVTLAERPGFHAGAAVHNLGRDGSLDGTVAPSSSSSSTWTIKLNCTAPKTFDGVAASTSTSTTAPTPAARTGGVPHRTTMSWLYESLACTTGWSRDCSFGAVRASWGLTTTSRHLLPTSRSKQPNQHPQAPAGSPPPPEEAYLSLPALASKLVSATSSCSVSLDGFNKNLNGSSKAPAVAAAARNRWSASLSWKPNADAMSDDQAGNVGLAWLWPKLAISLSPRLPQLRLWSASPASSASPGSSDEGRICSLSGWYNFRDSSWSCNSSLSKKMGTDSQFSFGWTRTSRWSWTYWLSWKLGRAVTLRVPISITPVMDPFWYPVQVMLTTLVAGFVQDVTAHILRVKADVTDDGREGMNGLNEHSSAATANAAATARQKAKRTAENQQLLMRRTAENRMRAEREKEGKGLVVHRAVYFTDRESLDVTVPMQFWVQDSVLDVGPATKKDLLGFYDLSYRAEVPSDRGESAPANGGTASWISLWFWRDDGKAEPGSDSSRQLINMNGSYLNSVLVKPKLKIEYSFHGVSYEVLFHDNDEILLPRARHLL